MSRLRVGIPVTYQFSVRYVLHTGLLRRLAEVLDPVVLLSWDDPDLVGRLEGAGAEVRTLPDGVMGDAYLRHRRMVDLLFLSRLDSPTTAIDRRRRDAIYSRPTQLRRRLRRVVESVPPRLPGGSERILGRERDLLATDTDIDEVTRQTDALGLDAVCSVTPYHRREELFLRAVERRGLPALASIISFDNPTSRPWMPVTFDRYLVWNRQNRDELVRSYPEVDPDRVVVTGAPQLDFYANPRWRWDEEGWRRRLGLPSDAPVVLFGGGPSVIVPHETQFLAHLDDAVAAGALPDDPVLLFRRHPMEPPETWTSTLARCRHVVNDEPWALGPTGRVETSTAGTEDIERLVSTLAHSAVHVSTSSTMTVDGAWFDRPQVGPAYDDDPADPDPGPGARPVPTGALAPDRGLRGDDRRHRPVEPGGCGARRLGPPASGAGRTAPPPGVDHHPHRRAGDRARRRRHRRCAGDPSTQPRAARRPPPGGSVRVAFVTATYPPSVGGAQAHVAPRRVGPGGAGPRRGGGDHRRPAVAQRALARSGRARRGGARRCPGASPPLQPTGPGRAEDPRPGPGAASGPVLARPTRSASARGAWACCGRDWRPAGRNDVVVGCSAPFTTALLPPLTRGRDTAAVAMPLLHLGPSRPPRPVTWALRRCDGVTASTVVERDAQVAIGVRPDRVAVLPPGCDPDLYPDLAPAQARSLCGLPERPTVGFVGRLAAYKGIDTFVAAVRRVWDEQPETGLLLAGSATAWSGFDDLVGAVADEAGDRLVVRRDFAEEDKALLLSACDVVASPSREESFGMVTAEAWCAGRAVVAASIPAVRCVVRPGHDGELVPVGDDRALGRARGGPPGRPGAGPRHGGGGPGAGRAGPGVAGHRRRLGGLPRRGRLPVERGVA